MNDLCCLFLISDLLWSWKKKPKKTAVLSHSQRQKVAWHCYSAAELPRWSPGGSVGDFDIKDCSLQSHIQLWYLFNHSSLKPDRDLPLNFTEVTKLSFYHCELIILNILLHMVLFNIIHLTFNPFKDKIDQRFVWINPVIFNEMVQQ